MIRVAEDRVARQFKLGQDLREHDLVQVTRQLRVEFRYAEIRLGENHLDVGHERAQEKPFLEHFGECLFALDLR